MKHALIKVDSYLNLMKAFPLNDLLSAVDMDKIADAITVSIIVCPYWSVYSGHCFYSG